MEICAGRRPDPASSPRGPVVCPAPCWISRARSASLSRRSPRAALSRARSPTPDLRSRPTTPKRPRRTSPTCPTRASSSRRSTPSRSPIPCRSHPMGRRCWLAARGRPRWRAFPAVRSCVASTSRARCTRIRSRKRRSGCRPFGWTSTRSPTPSTRRARRPSSVRSRARSTSTSIARPSRSTGSAGSTRRPTARPRASACLGRPSGRRRRAGATAGSILGATSRRPATSRSSRTSKVAAVA